MRTTIVVGKVSGAGLFTTRFAQSELSVPFLVCFYLQCSHKYSRYVVVFRILLCLFRIVVIMCSCPPWSEGNAAIHPHILHALHPLSCGVLMHSFSAQSIVSVTSWSIHPLIPASIHLFIQSLLSWRCSLMQQQKQQTTGGTNRWQEETRTT